MGKGEIVGPVVEKSLRGHPVEVANALPTLHVRGDLVSWRPVAYRGGQDPLAVVNVRLVDRQRPRRRVRVRRVVAGSVAGTAILGGLGYLTWLAVPAVVAHLAVIAGLIVVGCCWPGTPPAGLVPSSGCTAAVP